MKDRLVEKRSLVISIIVHLILFLLLIFILPSKSIKKVEVIEIALGDRFGEEQGLGKLGKPIEETQPQPKTQIEKETTIHDKTKKDVNLTKTKAQFDEPNISKQQKKEESRPTNQEKAQAPQQDVGTSGTGYDIQWGGKGKRKIYKYYIPPYPDGVQVEANVKLRFTILPDGSVTKITPLVKSHPVLESVSINALSRWKFEPLENDDYEQTVTIIFPFRLK